MAKKKQNEAAENEEILENAQETAEETTEEKNEADLKIEELQKELAASKEAHIRTLAEYDNYRKRTVKEKEASYGDAKANTIAELLPVLDNFDRALCVDSSDFEAYKKGVEMIYQNFTEILKKLGAESFGEKGEQFDPNIHNGVMHVEDDSFGENEIADVFSKGYRLGERILRPAMVKVAN